jgi:hypothetical protein
MCLQECVIPGGGASDRRCTRHFQCARAHEACDGRLIVARLLNASAAMYQPDGTGHELFGQQAAARFSG